MLPVANEPDDPFELKSTARFSISTIDHEHDDDDDEWFETATIDDADPVAAGLRFAADDDGDDDVRFGAATPCDAHAADGVSGDAAGAAAVDTDPPGASTSTSSFGARRCLALTFALLATGAAAVHASVGAFAAVDVSSGELPVVTTEHSMFKEQTAANRFFPEEHGAFAAGVFEAEYCIPDTVYDPPSMLPTSESDGGPFGTYISTELGADERAGFAALLRQHGGAFATAPGNLATATGCRIPLRAGAVPVSCRALRYSAENARPSLSNAVSHWMLE